MDNTTINLSNLILTFVISSQLESEISNESDDEVEEESLADRLSALKDIIPPSARRAASSSAETLTSFSKASLSFSGKALWIISTSAFLIGVPWALAYAEEEQYIQMEREQGMMKGANEVRDDILFLSKIFEAVFNLRTRCPTLASRDFHRDGDLSTTWPAVS